MSKTIKFLKIKKKNSIQIFQIQIAYGMPMHQVPFPYFYPGAKIHHNPVNSHMSSAPSLHRERETKDESSPPLNFSSSRRNSIRQEQEQHRNRLTGQPTPESSDEEHEESVNIEID